MAYSDLVRQMTLEEKAGMCSGKDMWRLKAVERLGIPSVMVTDGPHGLRKQADGGDHLGLADSVPATAFPTAAALASSFDRGVATRIGAAIGEECQQENVAVVLGPGANIKRSPLCGRNFEYFSEDPYLSGEMAAAHIRGVQSKNVGTSLKHFAVNNQETRRMSVDAIVDERTMREIYLCSFELAVKGGKPWTVMCSYNRINGVYACENPFTLTQVLRDEWGFDGYVMTDWGAMDDKVQAIKAGLDLQMPGGKAANDQTLVDAVKSGELDEAVLDKAVERILNITFRAYERHLADSRYDIAEHDRIAREAESECMVLLKNEGGVLPLSKGAKVAVIGEFARSPRYQGGGSSHIHPNCLTNALDAIGEYADTTFAPGFSFTGEKDEALFKEAVETAKSADAVILFAGLPDSVESEGFDREDIEIPAVQNELIEAIAAVQPKFAVVLSNGAPVRIPWLDAVPALLEGYLGGQASGGAAADVLFGKANPSGRLAETFPVQLSDTPAHLNFPGDSRVEYREGLYVGYRYYDKKNMAVRFPFGYGLSYTRFEYANLRLDKAEMRADETLSVTVDVTNTGDLAGKEVVQLYVAPAHKGVDRPVRELKGFDKIHLAPGETKTVRFELSQRAFAYWEPALHDWYAEEGAYAIEIGSNSRDIALSEQVTVHALRRVPVHYTLHSTLEEIMAHPIGQAVVAQMVAGLLGGLVGKEEEGKGGLGMDKQSVMKMMGSMPLRAMVSFSQGAFPVAQAQALIDRLNEAG